MIKTTAPEVNAVGLSISLAGLLLAGGNRVTEAVATIGVHVAGAVRKAGIDWARAVVSATIIAVACEPSANEHASRGPWPVAMGLLAARMNRNRTP